MDSKLEQLRFRAKTDHFWLATQVLGYDFVEETHLGLFHAFVQKDPAKTIYDQDVMKNRLILWPRGHFKSTAQVVDIIQWILCFPDIRFVYAHGIKEHAKLYLREIRTHFEANPRMGKLFPELCGFKLGTLTKFTVAGRTRNLKEPTGMVASERSVKAGLHFDLGAFDDLVHENNFRMPESRRKTIDDFQSYKALVDPGGFKQVEGTPFAIDDLYGWIKEHNAGSWNISARSCWITDAENNKKVLFPRQWTRDKRKEIGFTVDILEKMQREDPEFFSYQYECNPSPKSEQSFDENLIYRHTIPYSEIPKHGPKIMIIDISVSDRRGADEGVIGIVQINGGKMFVIDSDGGKWQPHETIRHICAMLMKWRPVKMYIERCGQVELIIPGLQAFASANNITSLPLEWIKAKSIKGWKAYKIEVVQTFFMQDRLWLAAGLPNFDKIIYQLVNFGKLAHDDWADMLGILCQVPTGIQAIAPQQKTAFNPMKYFSQSNPSWAPQPIEEEEQYSGLPGGMIG